MRFSCIIGGNISRTQHKKCKHSLKRRKWHDNKQGKKKDDQHCHMDSRFNSGRLFKSKNGIGKRTKSCLSHPKKTELHFHTLLFMSGKKLDKPVSSLHFLF